MAGHVFRNGGKFGGSHTTLTETSAKVADIVVEFDEVTNVSIGYLDARVSGSAERRVKIADESGGILLTVTGNGGAQKMRVFSKNPQKTKLSIAREVRNLGLKLSFR